MTPRIFAISVSHKTATIDVRERLAVSDDRAHAIIRSFAQADGEAALVRTCGRQELYVASRQGGDLLASFAAAFNVSPEIIRPASCQLSEPKATHHLLQVAAGLKSPMPGEHHILGQVRSALIFAQEAGTIGPLLSSLFRTAIRCGKRVRSETAIGRLAQSYATAALAGLRSHMEADSQILIVGSGTLANDIAHGLVAAGYPRITITSRHKSRGQDLAQAMHVGWRPLDGIRAHIQRASAVVCCTSSRMPLISAGDVPTDGRDRVFLDLGMPRNIDPRVTRNPRARLINLEQLAGGASFANDCLDAAKVVIDEEQERFESWLARRRAYYAGVESQRRHPHANRSEAAA